MLNQLMRYAPLVHMLKAWQDRILEIGSGFNGISAYLPEKNVVAVDPCFKEAAETVTGSLSRIKGSILQLPFADESFPVVVCSDVLEHLEAKDREKAILELWRVGSGRIFLSFPVKETHERWERRLPRVYGFFGKEIPDWLSEHLRNGLPGGGEVSALLKRHGIPFEVVPNENNLVHFLIMVAEASPLAVIPTYISDILSPHTWNNAEHSLKANIARVLLLPFSGLPRLMNFGSPVRNIFILKKSAAGTQR